MVAAGPKLFLYCLFCTSGIKTSGWRENTETLTIWNGFIYPLHLSGIQGRWVRLWLSYQPTRPFNQTKPWHWSKELDLFNKTTIKLGHYGSINKKIWQILMTLFTHRFTIRASEFNLSSLRVHRWTLGWRNQRERERNGAYSQEGLQVRPLCIIFLIHLFVCLFE